uniref:Uncharacterized protein n=1 Tax=Panagrolaimus superbus TaxID=310955 RepID=A0A914YV32_9BILA
MPGWSHTFLGTIQCASGKLLLPEASVTLFDGNKILSKISLSSSFRISQWSINATLTPDSKPFYRFLNICNLSDGFQEDIEEENGRPKEIAAIVPDSKQQPIKIVGLFNCSLGSPNKNGTATFGISCFNSDFPPPKRLEQTVKIEVINSMLARYILYIPAPYWPNISKTMKEDSETPCFAFLQNVCAKNDSAVAPIKLIKNKPITDPITIEAIPSPGPFLDCVKLYVKKPGINPKDAFEHLKRNRTTKKVVTNSFLD